MVCTTQYTCTVQVHVQIEATNKWTKIALYVSFQGAKEITIAWATAQMTMFDDPDRSKVFKGRRSSQLPQGHCTVCAARRTVCAPLHDYRRSPPFDVFIHRDVCWCLLQERCTHGAITTRANWETGPLMPSRGPGLLLLCRERKSIGSPVVLLTLWPGQLVSPPMLENCRPRYCPPPLSSPLLCL